MNEARESEILSAVIGSSVYDTETGKGDSSILTSFKQSALEKALCVLACNKRNDPARRVAKWAVRPDFHDPDLRSLSCVWRQAGFETHHLIFNPPEI